MKTTIGKWGNGAAVRIPVAVMHAAHLELGQEVDIRAEGGQVVIQPWRPAPHDLASLLDGITEDNLHAGVLTGDAVGREGW